LADVPWPAFGTRNRPLGQRRFLPARWVDVHGGSRYANSSSGGARADDLTVVDKHAVVDRWDTQLSPMPSGLLVTLTEEEILDLLAFLKEKR
jgi:hypothetical protein